MSILFVPMVVPPQQPSRRARELAQLLDDVIKEYERTHSAVTPGEIREALMLTEQKSAPVAARRLVAVLAGLVAVMVGGLIAFARSSGVTAGADVPWMSIAVLVVLVVMVFVAVLRRRP